MIMYVTADSGHILSCGEQQGLRTKSLVSRPGLGAQSHRFLNSLTGRLAVSDPIEMFLFFCHSTTFTDGNNFVGHCGSAGFMGDIQFEWRRKTNLYLIILFVLC